MAERQLDNGLIVIDDNYRTDLFLNEKNIGKVVTLYEHWVDRSFTGKLKETGTHYVVLEIPAVTNRGEDKSRTAVVHRQSISSCVFAADTPPEAV